MSDETVEQDVEPTEVTAEATGEPAPAGITANPVAFGSIDGPAGEGGEDTKNLNLLMDVPVTVSVEVGRTMLPLEKVMTLGPGAVIELDKKSEEPVDVCVNGRLVAHGEVVVVDDCYGIRITQIVDASSRIESLRS